MDTMSSEQMASLNEGDSIPNFLMLEQIPANYVQQVETDLLEPVVRSQSNATVNGFCRFTLQNKGFLHSHSKIFVSLIPEVNIARGYLQPHVGIGQIIKKAVLKIGNKTLNELDSWSGLHAIKSTTITNEQNYEREMFTTGRWLSHEFEYNAGSKVFADSYGLQTGMEKKGTDRELPDWYVMNTAKTSECPSFQIDLSDLFPFLKVNQLPLYMIKEPITIELTFQTLSGMCQRNGDDTGVACGLDLDSLKFCADYIFYGASDEMSRYAAANQDMSFSFVDYRLIENSTTQAALESKVIRNLGMANRVVPRVLTCITNTDEGITNILGQNIGIAPLTNASGVQSSDAIRYNIRYNDRFEYTSDVDNVARLFSNLTQSEGVPFVTRAEFSDQTVDSITGDTVEKRIQQGNLQGKFFYLGTRLTNGRVGQRGIEVHLSGVFPPSGVVPQLMRSYCEYVRVARLSGGMFEVYNA